MRTDYHLYIQTVTGWRSMDISHLVTGGILADDMFRARSPARHRPWECCLVRVGHGRSDFPQAVFFPASINRMDATWWTPEGDVAGVRRCRLRQVRRLDRVQLVFEDSVQERVLEVQNRKRASVIAELGEGAMERTHEDIKAVLAEDESHDDEADEDDPKDNKFKRPSSVRAEWH
ncbi:hypothetical protein BZA05DRAFT_204381 [Tricharina praecox]|uniref:uncharacterized protein n=1 Tax=Tricharina praecox TaxID=43433 RepID=UPI00221EC1AA|nr:uncharacterized protein BZA05DRAFT_204381 [Tricharina praecox]KAI5856572.1 hypothetical protein BZA05DRAFT_204381 [Tricharina praecox]